MFRSKALNLGAKGFYTIRLGFQYLLQGALEFKNQKDQPKIT
jgi:hypothetical protein